MLKATACEIMPHCGVTLARVLNSFFAIERKPLREIIPFDDVLWCLRFVWIKGLQPGREVSLVFMDFLI